MKEDLEDLLQQKKLKSLSSLSSHQVLIRYKKVLLDAISDELKNLSGVMPKTEILRGCVQAILRDQYWHADSGVVIAGFGTKEVFPALRCYKLDSIISNKIRVIENIGKRSQISGAGETAAVAAFAQDEMVGLFMDGIDEQFHNFIRSSIAQLLVDGYPAIFDNILPKTISKRQRAQLLARIKSTGANAVRLIADGLRDYSRDLHSQPIVEIVNHLPKEELADMAEALVNLTSFKRHVTQQAETVGGPVDVARDFAWRWFYLD